MPIFQFYPTLTLLFMISLSTAVLGQVITPTNKNYERRDRPVEQADVAILKQAKAILSEESVWDRNDDRVCLETDTEWSLFCALYKASLAVTGVYDHRRVAIQEVRFAIEDVSRGKKFEHRLMDFNNRPETTFEAVHEVIRIARERVERRLLSGQ